MQSREICPSQLCHSIREAFGGVFDGELDFEVSADVVAVVNAVGATI